ncbi:NTF2-like protein [Clavulina sp. PMI_390]|nr:NTF2-like protein [Clavulina sp. PMI_390]
MESIAAQFINQYYGVLDGENRNILSNIYLDDSVLKWDDSTYRGTKKIVDFFKRAPMMNHENDSIKARVNQDGTVDVKVTGKVLMDWKKAYSFTETFRLVRKSYDLGFDIMEQTFTKESLGKDD